MYSSNFHSSFLLTVSQTFADFILICLDSIMGCRWRTLQVSSQFWLRRCIPPCVEQGWSLSCSRFRQWCCACLGLWSWWSGSGEHSPSADLSPSAHQVQTKSLTSRCWCFHVMDRSWWNFKDISFFVNTPIFRTVAFICSIYFHKMLAVFLSDKTVAKRLRDFDGNFVIAQVFNNVPLDICIVECLIVFKK